jgi:hypothetical protein
MAKAGNPLDSLVDDIVERISKAAEELVPEEQPPFASQPLSREEQVQRYLEIREDSAKWAEILEEQGLKDTITYATQLEALLGKGGGYATDTK